MATMTTDVDDSSKNTQSADLLVLVIAGSSPNDAAFEKGYQWERFEKRYQWERRVWRQVIQRCKDLPMNIYLITMNPNITEPRLTYGYLVEIPGKNSLIPGVLDMTI